MSEAFSGCPTLIGVDHDFSIGGTQRVFLHWQGTGTQSCTAQLSLNGAIVGSAPIAALAAGDQQTISIDVPPTDSSLQLTILGSDGQPASRRTAWGIWATIPLGLPPAHPQDRYVPLGGGITLVGADSGVNLDTYNLYFLARHPLLRENALSLRAGTIQQDSAPALGALPTIKWIAGPTITDRHLIYGDVPHVQIILYDLYTQQSLPILDPKLAQIGPLLTVTP
jgi:hypothetical protein